MSKREIGILSEQFIMGKRNKKSHKRSKGKGLVSGSGADELHAFIPGNKPSERQLEIMTKKFQEDIRNSPVFDEMVLKFGREQANKLLKEFKITTEQVS